MIHFLIFAMSMATGMLIGYSLTLRDKDHLRALEKFSEILIRTGIYVNYNRLETAAIMELLSDESGKMIKVTGNGELYFDSTAYFTSAEKELVKEYNRVIGSTDAEGQTALLGSIKARLDTDTGALKEKIFKKGNLYITLGTLIGTAFGIIMM